MRVLEDTPAVRLLLAAVGGLFAAIGAAAAAWDGLAGYADGCGHGSRVAAGGFVGAVGAILFVAVVRRPPTWLCVAFLGLMLAFVAADLGLSNDYLNSGRCRYSSPAATEDALGAGAMTFAGGIALVAGFKRRRG